MADGHRPPKPRHPNVHDIEALGGICAERADEFDVIVVGGGGSGATAAVEAAEQGGSVIVLEKADTPGGSTEESSGTIRLINDRDGAVEHVWHLGQGTTPKDVVEAYVDGLVELPDWVAAREGELVPGADPGYTRWVFPALRPGTAFPGLPFADALGERANMRPTHARRVRGAALWDFLARNLDRLEVPLVVGARVCRLVEDDSTRAVVGVEVETPEGIRTIRARRGVILCCGGFAYDPEMQRQFLGVALSALSPPGRNTGDGVRMAQQVGADLWHMTGLSATIGYEVPEFEASFHCRIPAYGFVMVDQRTERYVCETDVETHAATAIMMTQDPRSGGYPRMPSYVVFDDETRRAGRLAKMDSGENRHYPWSADNSVEIERGWFQRADTVAELAGLLGLDADRLTAVVDEFNRCATEGVADAFGRGPDKMRPLVTTPFYGAPVFPSLVNTQGGPRRDAAGAVLRPDGSVVPGLFSAGELGSIWHRLYPGAGNVSECLVSGRLAARSAMTRAVPR